MLARRLAADALSATPPDAAAEAVKLCLMDFIACALEARALPPSRAARQVAEAEGAGDATIIGSARRAGPAAAAFANAVAGHGLVREDMHAAAVSHLGVVVLPALLALAQQRRVTGAAFIAAVAIGYEVGARVGRALVTPIFSRQWRPTGFTGPLAVAAAGARLIGLTPGAAASALSLAANTASGLNEWPRDGGEDMFFHPGFAARNGLTALALAEAGAYGSAGALDGPAGLFAAAGATPPARIPLFGDGVAEIGSVFRKALPLCNFAQTPAQAAQQIRLARPLDPDAIATITVRASEAAVRYPGCASTGPFERVLQAKMSIPFCVAAALLSPALDEAQFALPANPALLSLAARVRLETDEGFTQAFPARQGATVSLTMRDGTQRAATLADLEPASPDLVRRRFVGAVTEACGAGLAAKLRDAIEVMQTNEDVGAMIRSTEAARSSHDMILS